MYLFDTDAHELYVGGDSATLRRVQQNTGAIWLSSVAAEELLNGCLSAINRARSVRNSLSLPRAHLDFVQTLDDIRAFPVLAYSERAEEVFRTFSASTLRIGSQDCRIAAQAITHGLTVVTRNLRHFQAIGAPCEDWSV